MNFNYANSAATARKLLTKFGQSMTVTSASGESVYDPGTGTTTVPTPTITTANGVILSYKDGLTNIEGSLIQKSDKKILISISVPPGVDDTVLVGADTWHIIAVKELEPAGVNVMHELQVRK